MAVAIDKIEAVAPDQASLAAALKVKPVSWSNAARDSGGQFAWGECQGSGSSPYRVALALSDLGAKCTCPSRKFPCKHSLGLMLHFSRNEGSFGLGEIPDFVSDWAGRRRGPATAAAANNPVEKAKHSLAAAEQATEEEAPDPQAEARAAKQRERLKAERETSILGGLDDLDRWIGDVMARGLPAFLKDASNLCRVAAQRLVDAKAPALAARIDAFPSQVLSLPLERHADAAVDALGSWHMLAQAYRRQDELPEALRHDVRRLAGWNEQRQDLLDNSQSLRITGNWTVLATFSEVQPDKQRRNETWLTGDDGQTALLLDFLPVATGSSGPAFLVGERFGAELVFYPSAEPLRALLVLKSEAGERAESSGLPDITLAITTFEAKRVRQPWLGAMPIRFRTGTVRQTPKGSLWITDGQTSLPLDPRLHDELIVLYGMALENAAGFWDGQVFAPVSCETQLGRWVRL
jgi:SWIM zinc finger